MRKLTTVIILIIALSFTLGACSANINPPQPAWNAVEEYTYSVTTNLSDTVKQTGSLKVKVENLIKQTVTIGTYTLTDFYGSRLTSILTMDNGDSIESISYINNKLFTQATSRKYNIAANPEFNVPENVSQFFGVYEDNHYKFNINGVENSIKYKKSTVILDNESIYTVLRGHDLSNSKFTKSASIPLALENQLVKVSITLSTSTTLSVPYANDISCYTVRIALNDDLAGNPFIAYFAQNNITYTANETDYSLKFVPIKMIEGNTEYELVSIDNCVKS